jgi:hypothetical protein
MVLVPTAIAAAAPAQPGTLTAAGPAIAAPQQVSAGSAVRLGATNTSQLLRLAIGLKTPNAAQEDAFLASLQDKNSPNFHKYLTAAQWNARFSPSAASESAVVNWATSHGLTVSQRYPNRLVVDLVGSVGAVQNAFGVNISNYRLGTKTFYSNDRSVALPKSLSSTVVSVQGLNSLQDLVPNNPAASSTPASPDYAAGPAKAVAGGGHANGSRTALAAAMKVSKAKLAKGSVVTPNVTNGFYDPTDIYSSQAYDVNALYNQGHCCNPTHAANVTPPATSIAIATVGTHSGNDVAGFHNQYPYLAYHYQEFYIDGTPSGLDLEGTMDLEWATAMSNSFGSFVDTSMVYWYSGANAHLATFTDIWNHMLSDGVARTMSSSWGCAESYCYDSGTASTDHSIFASMVGQGWTLVSASDDKGPYADCSHVSVEYPSSDPLVVSAGGTTLQAAGGWQSEVAWTGGSGAGSCANNNGGGGGGCSVFWSRPSWQSGPCTNRSQPDISLNASIGQNIFFNGSLIASGGTSIAAPELGGIFAQIDAYLEATGACGLSTCPTLGDPHSQLYHTSPRNPYYDITSGCTSNDIGGGWCAGTGYDLATGLGSINALNLAWNVNWFSVAEATPPTTVFSGPSQNPTWINGGTISWTTTDGGSPATGLAGYTARWDADPGNPTTEPHGGAGNPFWDGPAVRNTATGSVTVASGGQGCHTLYVRSWDNIGDSAVQTYSVCYDGTAPLITSKPNTRIGTGKLVSGNPAIKTSWTASDTGGSGLEGYYVYRSTDGGSFTYLGFQAATSITEHLASGHKYQYAVYALDNAGNLSGEALSSFSTIHMLQETGAAVTFSSGWTSQTLSGASGGSVKYSTVAGKTATFTFTGVKVAVITTLGSNRGSASIKIDGGAAATMNTNASTTTTADIAFSSGNYAKASHTLVLTNLGTSGHSRVDVDAFVWIS